MKFSLHKMIFFFWKSWKKFFNIFFIFSGIFFIELVIVIGEIKLSSSESKILKILRNISFTTSENILFDFSWVKI